MPNNPHLNPICDACVHSIIDGKKKTVTCTNEEGNYYNKVVNDEAKECNLYRLDTNMDDYKESIKGGW